MHPYSQRVLININEVAEILDLSVQTIRNKLSTGCFPIVPKKVGGALRWHIRDIDKYLDGLEPLRK